jgi:hypothetical protein
MGRLLAVVAAVAGACVMGAQAFIPALPASGAGAVQQQQGTCFVSWASACLVRALG